MRATSKVSRPQAAADQRRLPHDSRAAAGDARARRQGDAVSDVGRRAVRAADRLRQRREPRPGPLSRAAQGAGDAARARRRPFPRRPAAGHREHPADAGVGGRRPAASAMRRCGCSARSTCRSCRAARRFVSTAWSSPTPSAVAAIIGLVLGLIPVANVLPANLTVVLREEGRGGTAGRGARALRRSLVVTQVAFAFVLLIGAGLMFASFRQVLAIQPGFNADGVLTANRDVAAHALHEGRSGDRVHARGAGASARAAGRDRGRRDRHDSVRRQQQQQRDFRRGLSDEAGRVGRSRPARST